MLDAIIIGGGIVGLVQAHLLKQAGLKIVIIEQNKNINNELRYSAINHASAKVLKQLNIWDKLSPTPYRTMQVWNQTTRIKFHAAEVFKSSLGHIIANADLMQALEIECLHTKPIAFENTEHITLQLEDRTLKSRYLIGADGANSWVRSNTNITTIRKPYDQIGLVANVRLEKTP